MSDDWIRENQDEWRRSRAASAVTATRRANGPTAARANALARQTGLPADMVERQLPEVEARTRAAQRSQAIRQADPRVQQWFSDPRNTAAAADDLEKLLKMGMQTALVAGQMAHQRAMVTPPKPKPRKPSTWLEGASKIPARIFGAGAMATGRGLAQIGVDILPMGLPTVGRLLQPLAQTQANRFGQVADREAEKIRERNRGDSYVTEGLLAGTESILPTIGAALTRSPALAATAMGVLAGEGARSTGMEKGLSDTNATLYGVATAIPEAGFELLPMGELLKVPGRSLASGAARYLLAEMPSELATTVAQSLTDWAFLPENKDKTLGDWVGTLPEDLAQTALGVLGGGGATALTMKAGSTVAERLERRRVIRSVTGAVEAQGAGSVVDSIMEGAQQTALREHDPEGFRDYVAHVSQGTPIENVFIPAAAIRELYQEGGEQEHPLFGQFTDQIAEAEATDGDVVIPLAEVATHLAGTPEWGKLRKRARFTPGGYSENDLGEIEERFKAQMEERVGQAVDQAQIEASPTQQVFEDVYNRLLAIGRTPQQASRDATIIATQTETRAARRGMDALTYHQQRRLVMRDANGNGVSVPEGRALDARGLPTLKAAVRHKGKVYSSVGDHLAAIAQIEDPSERAAAMRDGDNRGFVDDRGRYLDRFRAQEYAVANGLLSPDAPEWAKTSPDLISENLMRWDEQEGRTYEQAENDGRDRAGSGASGDYAPLDGATRVGGQAFGPIPAIVDAARAYAEAQGIPFGRQAAFAEVDEDRARRIADAYAAMEHAPQDPAVAEAYADLIRQTRAQYDALVAAGFEFTFFDENSDPYAGNPWNAMRDLRDNKRMAVFSSRPLSETSGDTFGSGVTDLDVSDNPLLAETGLEWPDAEGNLHPVLANDLFRAVHDAFGHGIEGAGFRAQGEENAWQAHVRLFTGPAVGAITSETRGQNSWLNYGPHGETNQTASVEETKFADQKTGLMPEWTWTEGRVGEDRALYQAEAFYSALEKAVEAVSANRAPAGTWKATLRNAVGVKREEIEDTGIEIWLDEQTGPVSKEDVLNFVRSHGVVLEETILGAVDEDALQQAIEDRRMELADQFNNFEYDPAYVPRETENEDGETVWEVNGEEFYDEDEAQERADELDSDRRMEAESDYIADNLDEDEIRREVGGNTIWESYSLSGEMDAEDSYTEWLLQLPPGKGGNPDKPFTGDHWSSRGHKAVVAHARTFEMRDGEGKKTLVVEEMQADVHQQAAKRAKDRLKAAQDELFSLRAIIGEERLERPDRQETPRPEQAKFYDALAERLRPYAADYAATAKALEEYEAAKAWNGYKGKPDPKALAAAEAKVRERRAEYEASIAPAQEANRPAHEAVREVAREARRRFEQTLLRSDAEEAKDAAREMNDRRLGFPAFENDDVIYAPADLSAYYAVAAQIIERTQGTVPEGVEEKLDAAIETYKEWDRAANALDLAVTELNNLEAGGQGIPDTPLKGAWTMLLMKRLIMHAAANGFERIAWIKEGENNGKQTPDDKVGWYYEKVLPNEVNKFIKKFGAKVKPVALPGFDVPENAEAEAMLEQLSEDSGVSAYQFNPMLGRKGFDQGIDAQIEYLGKMAERSQQTIDSYEGSDVPARASIIETERRRIADYQAQIDSLNERREEYWQRFQAIQDLVVPGVREIDEKAKIALDEQAAIEKEFADLGPLLPSPLTWTWAEQTLNRVRAGETFEDRISAAEASIASDQKAQPPSWVEDKEGWLSGVRAAVAERQGKLDRTREFLAKNGGSTEAVLARLEELRDRLKELPDVEALARERQRTINSRPTNLGFDVTDELKSAAREGFALYQNRGGPRGRISGGMISGTDDPTIMDVFKLDDPSTVMHEFGHLMLEELRRDARLPDAPQSTKDEWAAINEWFRQNGYVLDERQPIPTGAHELFARGWERYLMEGKAPVPTLQRVFSAFRDALLKLYRTVVSLNSPITPEVRRVFDLMLATHDEIEAARDAQGAQARFENAEQAGMTPAEFEAYRKLADQARDSAFDEALNRAMATIRRQRTLTYRREKERVREDVTERINGLPVFRAMHLLRTGRFLNDPDREPVRVKLDRAWIVDRFGEEALADIEPQGGVSMLGENADDPETVANMVGFATGEEMVTALREAERRRRENKEGGDNRSLRTATIEDEVNAEMDERHGNLLDEEGIEEEALGIVNNATEGEVIAAETRALAKRLKEQPTPLSLVREWAKRKIAQGRVVDVASRAAIQRYARAQAKAARAFEEALAAGNVEEAFRQSEIRLLNHALIAEAKKAADRIDVIVPRLNRVAQQRFRKSVAQQYWDRAHALLEKFEFRVRSQKALDDVEAFATWAAKEAEKGVDVITPPRLEDSGIHYTRMAVEELIALDDSVQQLLHLGRRMKTVVDAREKRLYEKERDKGLAVIEMIPQTAKSGNLNPSRFDRLKNRIASLDAALLKMEQIFDWLDNGNPNGFFNTFIFRPLAEAQRIERERVGEMLGGVRELLAAVPKKQLKRWEDNYSNERLLNRETGQPFAMQRQDLIAMALNVGNEGNFDKLAGGYGWNRDTIMDVLTAELSPEEWQFVQGAWDLIDTLWPEIEALEKRVNGIAPEKVEARTFTVNGVEMRGGYYPVVYDPSRNYTTETLEAKATDELFPSSYQRASTRQGFAKERTNVQDRAILLSLGTLNRHITEVLHDLTHREIIMQADRILTDRKVVKAVDDALGPEIRKEFRPWLAHIANEWAREGRELKRFDAWAKRLRTHSTIIGMGLRLTSVLSQVAGYAGIIERIGPLWWAKGLKAYAHPFDSFEFVAERSQEVRYRMDNLDRDIASNARELVGKRGALSFVRKHAFFFIGALDRMVVTAGWMGAYHKGMSEGMTEDEAAYYADKVIRSTQGAGGAKDLAAIQRDSEWLKLATMFYSYASAYYNRQRALGRDVRQAKASDMPALVGRGFMLMVVGPILGQLPGAILGGSGPDDDEDETYLGWGLRLMAANLFYGIPIVRDVASSAATGFDYQFTPVSRAIETVMRSVGDLRAISDDWVGLDPDEETEPSKRAVKTAVEAIGYAGRLPVGQFSNAAQFMADWFAGDADPDGVGEWLTGLQRGKLEE